MSEEKFRAAAQIMLLEDELDLDSDEVEKLMTDLLLPGTGQDPLPAEDKALRVRTLFGDRLPDGLLDAEAEKAYERLYGAPRRVSDEEIKVWSEDVREQMVRAEQEGLEDEEGGVKEAVLDEEGYEENEELVEEEEDGEGAGVDDAEYNWDDARLAQDMAAAQENEVDEEDYADSPADTAFRAHPLTAANRFSTSPSSLELPRNAMIEPIKILLSTGRQVHLTDAAHRIYGGIGLPHSASTPGLAKTMQQKAIPVDSSQGRMSEIDADTFLAVLMPAMYSTVMSVLVETRKRMGTAWAENLVRKAEAGELKILDAGGAGAGVLAVRELIRAEWERMHEENGDVESELALAEADGQVGGASIGAPLGQATVLSGSDALRARASALLENTTFIPRMPDYAHTETAKYSGKFDIVIAPHTIWPIREDWQRRLHVDNLWSLTNADGGILVVLEKGVARGFEAVAAAREHLLNTRIASPGSEERSSNIEEAEIEWDHPEKEKGMIIAPCTNHTGCPMYSGPNKGTIKGRKDICHFEQRYVRPSFLQKILGAKDKNFEDVKFSYVALMRGRDLREPQAVTETGSPAANQAAVTQGPEATDRAFEGYGDLPTTATQQPHSLSLPRQILPPLKRRGHVILDLCTPAGTLERWTVPRSFSKQAFRDARKSSWGDLWALGAKTRVLRQARVGDPKKRKKDREADGEVVDVERVERKPLSKRKAKEKRRVKERQAGKRGVLLGAEDM